MRTKLLVIITLPLLLLQCQTSLWTKLIKKESKLFSDSERIMIKETTASINFGYGYEPELDIDYVFRNGHVSDKDISAKSGDMKKILQKYPPGSIIPFYEKVLVLIETQKWKLDYAKEVKNWHDFTFIQKYTLPDAEQYLDILEKYVLELYPAYISQIDLKKRKIKKTVHEKLRKERGKKDQGSSSKYRLFH